MNVKTVGEFAGEVIRFMRALEFDRASATLIAEADQGTLDGVNQDDRPR